MSSNVISHIERLDSNAPHHCAAAVQVMDDEDGQSLHQQQVLHLALVKMEAYKCSRLHCHEQTYLSQFAMTNVESLSLKFVQLLYR